MDECGRKKKCIDRNIIYIAIELLNAVNIPPFISYDYVTNILSTQM